MSDHDKIKNYIGKKRLVEYTADTRVIFVLGIYFCVVFTVWLLVVCGIFSSVEHVCITNVSLPLM